MQATVHSFDASSGAGEVIRDDGVVLPFAGTAWTSGMLRTLRPGQRVKITVHDGRVTALTLATFTLPDGLDPA